MGRGNRRSSTFGACALGALLLLSSCTTYEPLGAGSQVPWAEQTARTGVRVVAAPGPSPPKPARPQPASAAPRGTAAIQVMTEVAPPPPRPAARDVHRVAAGEALSQIAHRYGVTTEELAAANAITPPYTITVGQTLRIPDRGTATAKATLPPRPAPERPATTERYVVQNGDALIRIARRFDVPAASIARANEIRPPYRLRVGQTLTIPGTDVAVTDERSGRRTAQTTGGEPHVLSGKGFLWPVSGNVIAHFGDSDNGQRRQGIAIAARMGAPVRAAEAGTVVYAGDAIRGYGRMILIRHADGYVSAYAHNSAILVNVGETVDRGQVIARVGASGGVGRAQLHFELRKGRKPIDPETVLVRDSTEVASTE